MGQLISSEPIDAVRLMEEAVCITHVLQLLESAQETIGNLIYKIVKLKNKNGYQTKAPEKTQPDQHTMRTAKRACRGII
jgi:hypothetical protein